MLDSSRVADLAMRKRMLVTESELQREAFIAQVGSLRDATARAARLINLARSLSHMLVPASAVLGFFLSRRQRSSHGLLRKMLRLWRFLRHLLQGA